MSNIIAYIVLIFAVILGTAANGFAKSADGFTSLMPSLFTTITIVGCMFTLSIVMKTIPVGITYASFAGLCIIATTIVGIFKFNCSKKPVELIVSTTNLKFLEIDEVSLFE